jgi:hypothetical protein
VIAGRIRMHLGGQDETAFDAIAERYQMEVVGPVPEGYL